MSNISCFFSGVIFSILLTIVIYLLFRKKLGSLFFIKDTSNFDFETTVTMLRSNITRNKRWNIVNDKDINTFYEQKGYQNPDFRIHEFKLGNSEHSYAVCNHIPQVTAFMPASIVIVQKPGEKVSIYRKNTALMGEVFPGITGDIMKNEVPKDTDRMLTGIVKDILECQECQI